MDVPELQRGERAGWGKCTTKDCRTPKPKSSQDVESAGLWACSECSYLRNFAGREACYKCGGSEESGEAAFSQERQKRPQESRGHCHRPVSFAEVLTSTVQDPSVEMDTSEQHRGSPKIISKLEDVGGLVLADLVAALKEEWETLRGRLQELQVDVTTAQAGPGCTGRRLRAHIAKLERSWRRCGGTGLEGSDFGARGGSTRS